MKTYGKDKDYRKALSKNLIYALKTRQRIKTTLFKAKRIKREFVKKYKGALKIFRVGERKGDGTKMVILEWIKKDENKVDTTQTNNKKMVSR